MRSGNVFRRLGKVCATRIDTDSHDQSLIQEFETTEIDQDAGCYLLPLLLLLYIGVH